MKSTKTVLIAVGLMLACGPAWSQTAAPAPARVPGYPRRIGGLRLVAMAMVRPASSGRGQKTPETPYTGPNKPIWHIADILKAHQGQARWNRKCF